MSFNFKNLLKRLELERDYEEKVAVSKVVDEFASKIKKEYKSDSKLNKIMTKVVKNIPLMKTSLNLGDISKSEKYDKELD